MKKFLVSVPVDYVEGYLRYGSKEAIIEANSMEEAKEIVLNDKERFEENSSIVVDDYEINDYGDLDFDEIQIIEKENKE